jgi:hypothetical protein
MKQTLKYVIVYKINMTSPAAPSSSTTTTVNLSTTRQILEISNNIFDCKILFVIETENETPFEFNVVDEETLKKNEFSLNRVDNGYATGTARNIQQPTYLVLSSNTPGKALITLQHLRNSTTSKKRAAAAATGPAFTTLAAPPAGTTKKFYQQTWFKLVLALIIVAAVYTLWKRMKKPSEVTVAAVPAAASRAAAAKPVASSLSIDDPTSNNNTSSFGF